MGWLNNVKNFLGFDDEDEKKKKQQQAKPQNRPNNSRPQSTTQAPGSIIRPNKQQNNPITQVIDPADTSIKLVNRDLPEPLKKAVKKPTEQKPATLRPADRALNTAAGSTARVITGVAQGVSGLADLVTPGKGTNRVSKGLDAAAKEIDKTTKRDGYESLYKKANIAGEIATYAAPNIAAVKLAKAAPKAAAAVTKTVNKVADVVGGDGGRLRKATATGMRKGLTPENLVADVAISNKYTGENASKGRDTNPATVAADVMLGVVGGTAVPMAGSAIKAGLRKVVNHTPGLRSVNPNAADDAAKQLEAEQASADEAARAAIAAENPTTQSYRGPVKAPVGAANDSPRVAAQNQLAMEKAEAERVAQEAIDLQTPAYQTKPARRAAQVVADGADGTPAPIDTPAFQFKQDMESVARQGETELNDFVNENPGATRQEIETAQASITQQVTTRINAMQAARRGEITPALATVLPAPAAVAPDVPVTTPDVAPVNVAPAPETPMQEAQRVYSEAAQSDIPVVRQNAEDLLNKANGDTPPTASPATDAVPTPSSVADGAVPELPDFPNEQVPIAPDFHDAIVRQLGPSGAWKKGVYQMRDKINLEELQARAKGLLADVSDEDLVASYSKADLDTVAAGPNGSAVTMEAIDRLSRMDDLDATENIVKNLMDALERETSKSGQVMRVAQVAFDNMPIPMKIRYIIKKIDGANAGNDNYVPLRHNLDKAAEVESVLMAKLKASQQIDERVTGIQSQIEAIAEAAKSGKATDRTQLSGLVKTLRTEKRNLSASNGELAKYFQDLMPNRKWTQRAFVDFPKRMMLASFAGRINDVLTTSANVLNVGMQNLTQGVLAKAVNTVAPGKVTDTLRGTKQFRQGTKEGVRQGAAEFGGTQYAPDLTEALKGHTEQRSGLQKATGPIGRIVQAATEFSTKASEGVRDQRLYQLAHKEAAELGLKGKDAKTYATARAAVPSRHMQQQADHLHMEVNNLNANPVSNALNRVAQDIAGKSTVGGIIKNQIMPFTSWLGGNIYNSVTDKNVIASVVKLTGSIGKGDPEGIVRNLAKTINNATYAYALGYALTEAGLITNENPQGYNDHGAYFKLGDRYIPVTFLGHFAPNIILGNAAHHGLNDDGDASPATKIVTAIENAAWNGILATGVTTALGVENNLASGFQAATRPGAAPRDGAFTSGFGALGQFIPGVTGDINAVMNNGIPGVPGSDGMNPTHEAALTKVKDPNSKSGEATDVPKTALNRVLNRIPVVSQQAFPRKAGVAADDMLDRVTRGDRETPGGKAAKAKIKTEEEQAADRKKRGVPETDAAIEVKFQNGDYDLAIEGVKLRMAAVAEKGELSKSDKEKYEVQIRRSETMRDKKITYDDYTKYDQVSLEEWRKLGDPDADEYDADLYEKLFDLDATFTGNNVSDSSKGKDKPKYYAKESKTGKGGSGGGSSKKSDADKAADAALKKIQSNTIGSTPDLKRVDLGDTSPRKVASKEIPKIQQIRSSDLIKKRNIKVSKA